MASPNLPRTCRALVYTGPDKPLELQTIPVPDAVPGSIIVNVIVTGVEHSMGNIISGKVHGITVPSPSIPGTRAIGRVAALGPDTTSFSVGQLVMMEPFVRARDNPDSAFLWGAGVFGTDAGALKLSQESWANGLWAEYVRAPLENCYALNEKRLCGSSADGGLGYSITELSTLPKHLVGYGGLRGINLQAGETIIVAPATGVYSGAAVDVACAMGARVIAVSRNLKELEKIAAMNPRVEIVQLKGNAEEDLANIKKFGTVDAYIDISPAVANESTHVRSCMAAVKPYGRVSLVRISLCLLSISAKKFLKMGVLMKDIAIPYVSVVINNLTIRGQYMYERDDARDLIKLVEAGVLKIGRSVGHEVVGEFALQDWQKAIEVASATSGAGRLVVLKP